MCGEAVLVNMPIRIYPPMARPSGLNRTLKNPPIDLMLTPDHVDDFMAGDCRAGQDHEQIELLPPCQEPEPDSYTGCHPMSPVWNPVSLGGGTGPVPKSLFVGIGSVGAGLGVVVSVNVGIVGLGLGLRLTVAALEGRTVAGPVSGRGTGARDVRGDIGASVYVGGTGASLGAVLAGARPWAG